MTRIKRMLSAVAITVALVAGSVHAQSVIYVNKNSTSATENGTEANPFKTIKAAAASTQLQAGTTIIVRGGQGTAEVVYEEDNIEPRASGTATGMIVFRPATYPSGGRTVYENVVIRHSGRQSNGNMITSDASFATAAENGQTTDIFNLYGRSYIQIEGFIFKDSRYAHATIGTDGVGNVVINNRFENIGCATKGGGIRWGGPRTDAAINFNGTHGVVRNNYFNTVYGEVLNYNGGSQDNVITENTIIGTRGRAGSESSVMAGRFEGNRHNSFAFNYIAGSESGRAIYFDICVGDFAALRNIVHNTHTLMFNESGCERNWLYENVAYNKRLNNDRRMLPTSPETDFPAQAIVLGYYPAVYPTGSTWDARVVNNVFYNVKKGIIFDRSWRDEVRNNIVYEDANNTSPPDGSAPGYELGSGWERDALGFELNETSLIGYHSDHGYDLKGGGPQIIKNNLWFSAKKDNYVHYLRPTQSPITVAELNAQINANDIAVNPGFVNVNAANDAYDFRLSQTSPARGTGDNGVSRGAYAIYEPGVHYDVEYDRGPGLYDVGYNATLGPLADVHASFARLNSPGAPNYLNGRPGCEEGAVVDHVSCAGDGEHYDAHRPLLKAGDVVEIDVTLNKAATGPMSFKVVPVAGDAWMQGDDRTKFPDFSFPNGQNVSFGLGERTKTVRVEILPGNPQHKRDQLLALRLQPTGSTALEAVGPRNIHLIKIRRVDKYTVTLVNANGIIGRSVVRDYIPNKSGFPTPPAGHHPFSITATRPGYDFLRWVTGYHEAKVRLANNTGASTTFRDNDLERNVTIQAAWVGEWDPWPTDPGVYTGDNVPVVTGITIPSTLALAAGDSSVLSPTIQPSGRTVHDVIWTSTNPRVATVSVSDAGVVTVTALSEGTATIRAKSVLNRQNTTADCVVTVNGTMTAPTPDMLTEGGYYTIRNVDKGRYMEAADANVAVGGFSPDTKWLLEKASDDYYYIRTAGDENPQYVSVANSTNDANAGLEGYTGTNSQQFKFVQVSGDMYLIRTRISNDASCVDADANGDNILQWVANGGLNQYWIVEFHPASDEEITSVLETDRTIPKIVIGEEASVVSPSAVSLRKFTAGPNPVDRSAGEVRFYYGTDARDRTSLGIGNITGTLTIYDATGNVVRKIKIADNADRRIGSWDLRDRRGRPVAAGSYLVRAVIKVNGKREKASVIVGVR